MKKAPARSTVGGSSHLKRLQSALRRNPVVVADQQPVVAVSVPHQPAPDEIARAQQAQRSAEILHGRVKSAR
jgi:hypothetical protein